MRKMSVLSLMLALALTAFAQPAAKGQLTEDLPNPAEIRPEDYRISRKDLLIQGLTLLRKSLAEP